MSNQTDAERIEALTAQVAALEGDLAQLRSAASHAAVKIALAGIAPSEASIREVLDQATPLLAATMPPDQRGAFEAGAAAATAARKAAEQ